MRQSAPQHRAPFKQTIARTPAPPAAAAPASAPHHFWIRIFSGRVPVCAATSFLRSPMVSSSLHLTRTCAFAWRVAWCVHGVCMECAWSVHMASASARLAACMHGMLAAASAGGRNLSRTYSPSCRGGRSKWPQSSLAPECRYRPRPGCVPCGPASRALLWIWKQHSALEAAGAATGGRGDPVQSSASADPLLMPASCCLDSTMRMMLIAMVRLMRSSSVLDERVKQRSDRCN